MKDDCNAKGINKVMKPNLLLSDFARLYVAVEPMLEGFVKSSETYAKLGKWDQKRKTNKETKEIDALLGKIAAPIDKES